MNYLYYEQEGLKQKYDTLIRLVSEVIEQLRKEETKVMNKSRVKVQQRCSFYNRGFCRENSACPFLHPLENCQEYCTSGVCSNPKSCSRRHPFKCKYWKRGYCWRKDSCLDLHKEADEPNAPDVDEVEKVLIENEAAMDDFRKKTNDESKDTENYSKSKNFESESSDNDLDCQGCGKFQGKFNCKECGDNFCIDFIIRAKMQSENFA